MQEKTQGQELVAEKQQLLHEREQLFQQLESAREKVHSLQASLNLVGANSMPVQVTHWLMKGRSCEDVHEGVMEAPSMIFLVKCTQEFCIFFTK